MKLVDKAICAGRAAWYGAYESKRLGRERARYQEPKGCLYSVLKDGSLYQWPVEPLVSVLIPTFNRAELLLTRSLPSVLKQTYDNLEVIVVQHGCSRSQREAWRYSPHSNDRRLRVIDVPRTRTYPPTAENHWLAGPVVPANAALKAARGDFIARCDDDDTWTPDHIEKLLRFAQEGDYEFVSSAYERERDGVREVVPHDGGDPPIGGTQTWLYRSYMKFFKYNPDCWRRRINRVNDTDLADRFRKAGVRIGWLDEVTAYVLPRPGETTVGLEAYRRDRVNKERQLAFS